MDESLLLLQREIRQLLLLFKKIHSFIRVSPPYLHPEEPGGHFFLCAFHKKNGPALSIPPYSAPDILRDYFCLFLILYDQERFLQVLEY